MALPPARVTEAMSGASHDTSKLPAALLSCGVALSAAALSVILFKAPPSGGIFLRLHGSTLVFLYYGSLISMAIFGLVEASFGYWWARNFDGFRTTIAKTMLFSSILPLVLVAALGGFVPRPALK